MAIEDSINRINGIIADIEKLKPKLAKYAATQARAIIERRIFNQGKAADASDIGTYTEEDEEGKGGTYKKRRENKGFQVDKVDLQLTGRLFEAIKVVEFGNRFVLAIVDFGEGSRVPIAGYLEERYKKKIFSLGKAEKVLLMEKVSKFAKRELEKIFTKWSRQ